MMNDVVGNDRMRNDFMDILQDIASRATATESQGQRLGREA